jgi:chromosome segregation ATPase
MHRLLNIPPHILSQIQAVTNNSIMKPCQERMHASAAHASRGKMKSEMDPSIMHVEAKAETYRAENEELKQRIARFEASGSSSSAALGQTNAAALCTILESQLNELKQQLVQLREQVEQQQATTQAAAAATERHGSLLAALGVRDAESARGQARMWDSTQTVACLQEQLQQQRAASAALEKKYEAQQVISGQLHSAVQALKQQLDKQGGAVTVVAHAPANMHPDQLVEHLAGCGGIAK